MLEGQWLSSTRYALSFCLDGPSLSLTKIPFYSYIPMRVSVTPIQCFEALRLISSYSLYPSMRRFKIH